MNHLKLNQILFLALGISIAFNVALLQRPERIVNRTTVKYDTKAIDSLTTANLGLKNKVLFLDSEINVKNETIKKLRFVNRSLPTDSVQIKFAKLLQAERNRLNQSIN